ncbi:protein CFAP276-like isoform X2 [Clytia hemisphaerica]|uniref:Uncharacterized protein n=1 Tax=Clytia hemisphaerica TaxID=252671 RepID=A0A7M5X2S3_9CNID|eukprot:TCONS_00012120-protein
MPRDPYPFPKFENDNDFSSSSQLQAQNQNNVMDSSDQWNRLYEKKTLASSRREVFHHDPQAPRDSLDFVIKSIYDHHSEFLQSSAETLYQPETLGLPHGRKLKNRTTPNTEKMTDIKKDKLKITVSEKRENIDSVKGAIPSHHSAATNRGYLRKHDGGFYGC